MSPRIYKRKFDYDEARRLRATGLSYAKIAAKLGASRVAVARACNDKLRQRMDAYTSEWVKNGTCPDCGGRATRAGGVQSRCRDCYAKHIATSVREGSLQCMGCREWKPDDAFPSSRNRPARRFRHNLCRSCLTIAKRDWRQRNAPKCPSCGEPRTGFDSSQTESTLCRTCWRNSRRKKAA